MGIQHKADGCSKVIDDESMDTEVAPLPRRFVETELWNSFNG